MCVLYVQKCSLVIPAVTHCVCLQRLSTFFTLLYRLFTPSFWSIFLGNTFYLFFYL